MSNQYDSYRDRPAEPQGSPSPANYYPWGLNTAEPQGEPLTDDELMKIARKVLLRGSNHTGKPAYKALTYPKWKDGIDVDYPTVELRDLADDLIRAGASATAKDAARLRDENKWLRRKLCAVYAGPLAYMDDGEAQDNTAHPFIDFLRDTPEAIESAMLERTVRTIARIEDNR